DQLRGGHASLERVVLRLAVGADLDPAEDRLFAAAHGTGRDADTLPRFRDIEIVVARVSDGEVVDSGFTVAAGHGRNRLGARKRKNDLTAIAVDGVAFL